MAGLYKPVRMPLPLQLLNERSPGGQFQPDLSMRVSSKRSRALKEQGADRFFPQAYGKIGQERRCFEAWQGGAELFMNHSG
jgi:hypothetical protein